MENFYRRSAIILAVTLTVVSYIMIDSLYNAKQLEANISYNQKEIERLMTIIEKKDLLIEKKDSLAREHYERCSFIAKDSFKVDKHGYLRKINPLNR